MERDSGRHLIIHLGGHLDAQTISNIWLRALRKLQRSRPQEITIEAGGVTYCDTAGVGFILEIERYARRADRKLRIQNFPDEYSILLNIFRKGPPGEVASIPHRRTMVENVGSQALALFRDCFSLISSLGEIVLALLHAARHPRLIRWRDVARVTQDAGVHAVPVVFLVGFLTGLIIAYQSANILHEYGGDVFLALVVGKTMVRELAPLMTAIILAARSSSAFAAELGTMKINEEIAALSTMGLNPTRFLIIPRILAAIAVTPLLSMGSILAGLAGGAVVSVFVLQLPLITYCSQLLVELDLYDLFGGLFKAFAYGMIIAAFGCIRGIQTRGGAAGVGASTTSAVVSAIVMIVIANGLFAILYYILGI